MRKQFYRMLGLISLVSWGSFAHAACTTPPTCAELGYTKSAADCSGHTFLKCPFDQSVGYCDNGAGSGVLKTYNVGDSYIANGVAIGIVVSVDSSRQHGTLVVKAGEGQKSEANSNCMAKSTGGLTWSLAKGSDICDQASKNHGLIDSGNHFKCTDSEGCYCYSDEVRLSSYDTSHPYFCSAPF